MGLKINELTAKSILIKSGLPGSDWVINPYNGCTLGCMYCYAAQIAKWKHPEEIWSSYVDVKTNAPQVLQRELIKLEKKFKCKDFGSIFFSSVTDPYQPIENQSHLTRQCLEVLTQFGYEGSITIRTKSPLIIKDITVLKKLKNLTVGFTVTALDDQIAKFLEVYAPPISKRLEALDKLHQARIPTYAFIGPLLPYVVNQQNMIKSLLDKLEFIGVSQVWFEHINLSPKIKARLYYFLEKEKPELISTFEKANTQAYRKQLDQVILQAMKGRKLSLGLGKVIHHRSLPKKKYTSF